VIKRQKITLALVFFAMFILLLVVILGDKGWLELRRLQHTHQALIKGNTLLTQENSKMYDTIDRLQNDPEYIENIARRELGMIRSNELIFKFNSESKALK
jgi:cell division protein FtsB